MPYLSIVTINFNNAVGLKKTIESVKNLSFKDYEHIIVDGGSTDGSLDTIKNSLKDKDYAKHVTWWCSEKDDGIYNAINKGISHANGIFIATLNSGDEYLPNSLDNFEMITKDNQNAIYYGAISYYKNDIFDGVHCSPASNLTKGMIPHPASFVPKSIYNKFGLYDENFKSSGDWELFLRFYKLNVQFYFLERIITRFALGGISNTNLNLVRKENEKLLKMHGEYKFSPKKQIIKLLRKIYNLLP